MKCSFVFSITFTMGMTFQRQGDAGTTLVREDEVYRSLCAGSQKKTYDLEEAPKIRIASFNIAAGSVSDIDAIARAIRAINPDIIALQEVDKLTARSGRIDQTIELAKLTGLHAKFGRAILYDGGKYGLALLSKYPFQNSSIFPLTSGWWREQRIALSAQIEVPGFPTTVTVINTHLDTSRSPGMRLMQVRELNDMSAKMHGIKFLCGDMNDVPRSSTWHELRRVWEDITPEAQDCRSWPAENVKMQLDYIFSDNVQHWHLDNLTVPNIDREWNGINWTAISDHLPIVADLRLIEYYAFD